MLAAGGLGLNRGPQLLAGQLPARQHQQAERNPVAERSRGRDRSTGPGKTFASRNFETTLRTVS
jgi:hypothetical protein